MHTQYLESVIKLYQYYKQLADQTFGQLSEEELFRQPAPDSNSVAIIAKHMAGNMRSRWTDFLTSDGEKEWRNREDEFIDDFASRKELLEAWESGWQCVLDALNGLSNDDLKRIVYIRNMGHTVSEAINRQMGHYAYHVGQIVLLGKMFKGSDWQALSIPQGGTEAYNAQKFALEKGRRHFTDDFLDRYH